VRLKRIAIVLALMSTLIGGSAARAEVEHPRQEWLRQATAGLFLHWGMFTSPRHLDCAQWERDVTGGGWSADYWVDEARKLGASYIVLATFHSRLGYARPWPSRIPGSCATQRDLLGELVAAGKAKDVHIILYMTDDPQWHNEQGVETLDSAAYSAYKGEQVDLTTRPGFGRFSYDLFFEVMERYPDLSGFWIDNDNEYWEQNHLYEQIRERRPTWLLSNNNEDTPIMDTVSNEQKTGMTPAYDYPQAAWTPMPRLVEADYKLPTAGDWWYDGRDNAVDFRLSTGRYITNAGSSMKSLMAETPMVNGKFPPAQESFNNFMRDWVPPIRASLYGTQGGGYMYGGMQPGFWNDGAHGVITVGPGAKTQYVHVVTRPRTDFVRLRDNGYRVTSVTDQRTGTPLRFHQSGGYLSILDIGAWDTYDTVFQVQTSGQQFFVDGVKSSSPELVDGDYTTYWDNEGKLPVSLTLDLGVPRKAAYLAINQREWSPTYPRSTFGRPEDSARIKDYRVYVSDDGVQWGQPVREGALPSARGVQFIDLGEQHARFVKLEVLDTWAGPQAPRFFKRLLIDEIRVASAYPWSPWPVMPLEAESPGNRQDGRARVSHCPACSGSFQVTGLGGGAANSVVYPDVSVTQAGEYRLQIDHTAGGPQSALSVSVNGGAPVPAPVVADSTAVPAVSAVAVQLAAGTNTVKLFSESATGPGIDRISVGPMPPASYTPKTTLTVEPYGLQWVGPGQQTVTVKARLRLDADDVVGSVRLAPQVPAGWSLNGEAATASSMRLGQTLEGSWVLTSPPGADIGSVRIPVVATFQYLGRAKQVSRDVQMRLRPADRVFMREAEDGRNLLGSTGLTGCGPCSGGEKVRNIGGDPEAAVVFPEVTVPEAGEYTLFIDFTVNGTRSYYVSANGGAPVRVTVSGVGNNTPYTTSVKVTLQAGANTLKFSNDTEGAPDLDRISLSR
jgi:Alpha-L-fucosidase/Carbohydrate binding module (family 35)/F5/8 type C domain/NPCBM-associated, NEW3 domain of alpha-galactosidase